MENISTKQQVHNTPPPSFTEQLNELREHSRLRGKKIEQKARKKATTTLGGECSCQRSNCLCIDTTSSSSGGDRSPASTDHGDGSSDPSTPTTPSNDDNSPFSSGACHITTMYPFTPLAHARLHNYDHHQEEAKVTTTTTTTTTTTAHEKEVVTTTTTAAGGEEEGASATTTAAAAANDNNYYEESKKEEEGFLVHSRPYHFPLCPSGTVNSRARMRRRKIGEYEEEEEEEEEESIVDDSDDDVVVEVQKASPTSSGSSGSGPLPSPTSSSSSSGSPLPPIRSPLHRARVLRYSNASMSLPRDGNLPSDHSPRRKTSSTSTSTTTTTTTTATKHVRFIGESMVVDVPGLSDLDEDVRFDYWWRDEDYLHFQSRALARDRRHAKPLFLKMLGR